MIPRTRIAPSPTGRMHIGTVRTALFNYLFAKRHGGTFFVRVEDTDKERNKDEWVTAIWDDFSWCGIPTDERFIQSQHLDRHRELLKKLVDRGVAYISKEEAKDGSGRKVEVVRLKNPGTRVTFDDAIRGEVSFDTKELGDFVIARSIDDPLYHFAVVADDGDAQVTHVLRAEEHISNTPRQILIQEALGLPRPIYGHLPLILAPDRTKLSKRKHGASIENYRAQGYSAQAIINYLALLGWNPGTPQEIFSMDELVSIFDLSQIQKSGAIFDVQKLNWFNREYIQRLPAEEFNKEATSRLSRYAISVSEMPRIIPLIRERIATWSELDQMFAEGGELHFLIHDPAPNPVQIPWKKDAPSIAAQHLTHLATILNDAPVPVFADTDAIKALIMPYAEENGRGNVLWPLRFALTGQERSPDPFTVLVLLGKATALARIKTAITALQ
ncbi:MAG: glutamate--tRNA ligase family protein [Patescibacteria group bacterium]